MKTLNLKQAKPFERLHIVSEKRIKPKVKKIKYPDSDGKPMAENTKQFNWIVKIEEGLELLFADNPDVFIAGDLLWYPIEGNNKIRIAPDAIVVFGRPKGDRGSYMQWEEGNISPQVVFEVLSPGNTKKEMENKLKFYEQHKVEEYYIYDPDNIKFEGWLRLKNRLLPIENIQGWISPLLKIRFELTDEELVIFRPDGQKFLSPLEMEQELKESKSRQHQAEMKLEQEESKAEQERKRAEQAESRAEYERKRAEMLEARLRELGLNL